MHGFPNYNKIVGELKFISHSPSFGSLGEVARIHYSIISKEVVRDHEKPEVCAYAKAT
jgi:hypothetical protein